MSTFEGPLMSLKSVNALSHYTDWTIGHVHSGALGWVALISFGAFYHMIRACGASSCLARLCIYVTSGWPRSASLSTPPLCGCQASCRA
jgi:cytochrome c oxidase cbb3-type subunit 1